MVATSIVVLAALTVTAPVFAALVLVGASPLIVMTFTSIVLLLTTVVAIGPVAGALLRSAGVGSSTGPAVGSVWGLAQFESRILASGEISRLRQQERLSRWLTKAVQDEVVRDELWGTLWQRDMYGSDFPVGSGVLVLTGQRLTFVMSTWFGWRGVLLGSAYPSLRRDDVHVEVASGAVPGIKLTGWRTATSLPGEEAVVRSSSPRVLDFLGRVNRLD